MCYLNGFHGTEPPVHPHLWNEGLASCWTNNLMGRGMSKKTGIARARLRLQGRKEETRDMTGLWRLLRFFSPSMRDWVSILIVWVKLTPRSWWDLSISNTYRSHSVVLYFHTTRYYYSLFLLYDHSIGFPTDIYKKGSPSIPLSCSSSPNASWSMGIRGKLWRFWIMVKCSPSILRTLLSPTRVIICILCSCGSSSSIFSLSN